MRNSRWVPAVITAAVVVALSASGVVDEATSGQAIALMLLTLLGAFFFRQYDARNKR